MQIVSNDGDFRTALQFFRYICFLQSEASFKAEKKRNDMIMKNRESVCNDILTERIVSLQSSAHLDWKHREQGLAISHLFFEILQGAQADKVVLREIFVFRG